MIKKTVLYFFIIFLFHTDIQSQNNITSAYYIADTTLSDVSWICGRHYGCVQVDTGFLNVVEGKIIAGEFKIDLSSVMDEDIDNMLLRLTLANVIKSFEFFNVTNFRYATFTLEILINIGENKYNVSGNLTLKDKTLPINFNCEIIIGDNFVDVYSDYFQIDRTKWGINYLSKKYDPEDKEQMHVPDNIEILVHLKAFKEKK